MPTCKHCQRRRNRKLLKKLLQNQELIMKTLEEIKAEVAEVRTNLTEIVEAQTGIGTRFDALLARLREVLSGPESEEIFAELTSLRAETQAVEDKAREMATPTSEG